MAELLFKGISRVNEFNDPELLEQSEVQVLDNMVLDKESGKAITRGGLVRQASRNNVSYPILSIYDANTTDVGNELLISAGTSVYKSANGAGSFSTLKTGLTSGEKARFNSYADKIIFSTTNSGLYSTDLTNVWNLGITKPDVSSTTLALSTGGDLGDSKVYKWVIVYLTATGEKSNPSVPLTYHNANESLRTTTSTDKTITFSSLPVSADTRVVSKLLYRTEGDGDVYYLLAKLDNSTTSYTDDNADEVLDLASQVDFVEVPNIVNRQAIHRERLFLGYISKYAKNYVEPAFSPSGTYKFRGVASAGGSLDASTTYKYRVVFADQFGNESNYIEITATTGVGEGTIELQNLPRLNTKTYDAYSLRIYRTEGGGSTFKFLIELDAYHSPAGNPNYTDTTADASLGDTYSAPSTELYRSMIVYSELYKPANLLVLNYVDIYPDDGDEITGLVDLEDRLIVFKKNSICQINTLGSPVNWQVQKIYEGIGCDEPETISRAGRHIYFVSNKQVYRFPDQLEIALSLPKKDTFDSVTTFYDSAFINSKDWYIVVCGTSTYDKVILIYDTKAGSWYEWTVNSYGNQYLCVAEKKFTGLSTQPKGMIMFGLGQTDEGWIHKYDETSEQDFSENEYILDELGNRILLEDGVTYWVSEISQTNIEIQPRLKTKVFTMDNPSTVLRARELLIDYKKRDGQSLNIRLENPATGEYRSSSDTENSSYSTKYKNIKKVTDAMTGDLRYTNKIEFTLSGAGLREFNGMTFHYRPERRGKRYE